MKSENYSLAANPLRTFVWIHQRTTINRCGSKAQRGLNRRRQCTSYLNWQQLTMRRWSRAAGVWICDFANLINLYSKYCAFHMCCFVACLFTMWKRLTDAVLVQRNNSIDIMSTWHEMDAYCGIVRSWGIYCSCLRCIVCCVVCCLSCVILRLPNSC